MVTTENLHTVVIPINPSGLIKIKDLLDMAEALDGEPEESYVVVLTDELRYESTR